MTRRSIGFPLALGVVLLVLVLALAVAWHLQILVLDDVRAVQEGLSDLDWVLLVLGAVFFVLVIIGVFWLCLWLVREIGVNQRQRAFIDAVTHEMRTPLASLQLHLETLERHDPDRKNRQEFLGRMRGDLERLDHTVEQVLTAARAEDSRLRPRFERVALPELLSTCIDGLRASHGLPEEAVQLEIEPDTSVKGDATELAVVFRNLLENAVKYSSDPVEVTVRVGVRDDGRVAVEIADRGIGIPSGELGKIFQRFYRVGRDVQRTASGLGLGLFIVRNLVRRQGGRVVARSEGWGQGSRFVVTLKAAR
ncbi:MAG: HAMP domain-containing sensor histidine kinase [Myxococcota bacterium]|nr:HAMP domain-containing sensor histidine kinase [Myxococcota bacterium]